jgi:hypothetical protein
MRAGDRISTPDGEGVIVDCEVYSRLQNAKRWGVALDISPFSYTPVYYWEKEVTSGTERPER